MIKTITTVHMTDNEVTNNFAAVLEKIRKGVEVAVERDHRPVAAIRSPRRSGRPISECIASAKPAVRRSLWTAALLTMWKKGSEAVRSHGTRPSLR